MKKLSVLVFSLFLSVLSPIVFAEPVDVNTADAKTLAARLDGVGSKTAEAIVAYRTKNGPFKRIEDLEKVKGVGTKTVERNRANLSLGGKK
ncbi:competence protein ComEA [Sulfurifustis variabilis]|uniref:Competence protein ComEA n=1 Tax=Sulfurifustis variabilis TaxID=1675686 RepID=A0A1B4V4Z3_9GAMM|nr:helix-hairpin-helix domain-containing protein [Sulfurifustis variabilis]BAU48616.1 competence protein ComEA [Sulfurifustis variabilis]